MLEVPAFLLIPVLVRYTALVIGGIADKLSRYNAKSPFEASNDLPLVSVIIPAYNEERVICGAIESALHSDYPSLQIIVVDDGSTDDTYSTACNFAAEEDRVKVIKQRCNQGKPAALNAGVECARGDYLVALDADTILAPDCIRLMVSALIRQECDAISANIKIGNRVGWFQITQSIDYITHHNFQIRGQAFLGSISCIMGPAGAFRRSAVLAVGGYSGDTIVEDTDVTLALLEAGFKVAYEPRAHAFTEAPSTFRALINQRTRWLHGNMQIIWKYRHLFFKYNAIGWYGMPEFFFVNVILNVLSVASIPAFTKSICMGLKSIGILLLASAAFQLPIKTFAVWLDDEDMSQLIHLPSLALWWNVFSTFIFIRICLKALMRKGIRWNKMIRTGELSESLLSEGLPRTLSSMRWSSES